jgi:mgtE-like transporter
MAGRAERSARLARRAKRAQRPALTTKDVLRPAKMAVRPALAFGSGVRQTLSYWRSERRTLRQGWIALSITALGNIPTGIAFAAFGGRLRELPGLIILLPGAIGMRGAIFGALSSRLSTSLNAGLLRFTRDRNGVLMQNVAAATLQTFLAVAARAFSTIAGLPSIPVLDLIAISVIGGVFASAIVLGFTIAITRVGQRRDWDLDSVNSPTITFIGDSVTLPALFGASFVAKRGLTTEIIGLTCLAVCLFALVQSFRNKRPITRRIVRESMLTITLASLLDIFAGLAIEHRSERFLTYRSLLILLPSFLSNAGALGGIVSHRLGSKLHLGAISPRLIPERLAALDISLTAPWAVANFALLGVLAHETSIVFQRSSPGLGTMVAISVIGGLIATAFAAIVAYLAAIWTFRFDLDPDNHGIAAVTSSMDLLGVFCLLAATSLTGAIP